jgi:hypothetical protein
MEAVGAGGGGGGGGGGGAAFFLHAPSIRRALRLIISTNHFILDCFTFGSSYDPKGSPWGQTKLCNYFQLQLGCVLRPVKVNC